MATLNLGRVRGDKGADSTVPGPRGIPGPQGPQGPAGIPGPKGEDATPINLGSAATKDVGIGAEQVPQNKNLGSAAFKNAGEATGNVMQVGAFGLGGRSARSVDPDTLKHRCIEGIYIAGHPEHGSIGSYLNIAYSEDWVLQIRSHIPTPPQYRFFTGGTTWEQWHTFKSTQNTTQDANGFLRDISSTKQTVAADPTGNVAVSSIQAGAGAPKVKHAFFNSVNVAGAGSIASVALGIPYNKILAISCLLGNTTTKYPPNHSNFDDRALYYVRLNRVASNMAAVQFILATGDQSSSLYYATTQIFVTYTE